MASWLQRPRFNKWLVFYILHTGSRDAKFILKDSRLSLCENQDEIVGLYINLWCSFLFLYQVHDYPCRPSNSCVSR